MKIHEVFLIEENQSNLNNPEELAFFMKYKCARWMSLTNNGMRKIYRGNTEEGDDTDEDLGSTVFIRTNLENRQPRGMALTEANVMNKLISIAGGIANRTNSTFSTGDVNYAGEFGPVHVYVPIGNFNMTWSPEWYVWNNDIWNPETISRLLLKPISYEPADFNVNVRYPTSIPRNIAATLDQMPLENFNEIEIKKIIKTGGVVAAVSSGHELMIRSDQGLMIAPAIYKKALTYLSAV